MSTKDGKYIQLRVSKPKVEQVRKILNSETPEQAIDQMLDDVIYTEKMQRHLKKYQGRGKFRKIYE